MDVKDKIINAIEFSLNELKFSLKNKSWGWSHMKETCALGCVLVHNNSTIVYEPDNNRKEAAKLLGVTEEWAVDFMCGFDDKPIHNNSEAYRLGQELRIKYNL